MLHTSQRRPLLAAFTVFLLAAAAAGALIWHSDQHDREEERARVFALAVEHAHNLQRGLEHGLSATYALATLVRQGRGTIPDFDAVARQMLPIYPGVSELALAPGGIIRKVVPLAGNEKALGLDLLQDPVQRKEALLARTSGKLTLAGPLALVQGGMGLVGRLPIFLGDSTETPQFWGYTLVVIRLPEALEAVNFPRLAQQGFAYELWRVHPDTTQRQVIAASSNAVAVEPVGVALNMPNATWTLSVAPIAGWSDAEGLALQAAMGLLLSALLGYVAKLLLDLRTHQQGLEAAVEARTAEALVNASRYRELFDANPQPMWVYDLDTLSFLAVNDAAVAHYGYSRDEFLAMRITDIRSPDEAARLMHRVAEVRKADIRDAGIWQHRRKDGTLIDVEVTAHTLNFGGRSAQIVHASDVTERLRIERKVRESEERYRALTELSADWYWEQDEHQRFTLMSRPHSVRLEIGPDVYLGKSPREFADVAWDESQLAALEAIFATRQPFRDFELSRVYRKGARRDMQLAGEPKFDAAGRFTGYRGVGKDITERKRAEQALYESEARFRSLTEMSSDFYWESDAGHRLTARDSANKQLSTVSVFSKGAQIGERRWEIPYLTPDASGWQAHRATLDAHLPFRDFELSRLGIDGTQRHISISGDPVFDASGAFTGYRGVGADITERKRAEAELRLAASVFENTQEAIFITDANVNIIAINRRFTEITGYAAAEAIGCNPRMLKSGRQGSDFYRAMWAFINTHGYWTGELWNRHKDGREFPEWLSISVVRDEHGKVINYVAAFMDISQRIAAEQALRASEEKFGKAFRTSPMFISISTVADGRYIEVNDAYLRGTGRTREEVIGCTAHEISLWKDPEDRQRAIETLRRDGHVGGFEAELCTKSGDAMVCEIWAEPIVIEDKPCVIWVTNDVSVRKKAEARILELNAELEQRVAERTRALEVANTELEAFSYSVSHDLRAPLRAIQGFSRLVETQYAGQIDDQGKDMLRRVGAGAQKMALLIDDLLNLSRISRQAMRIGPVDLSALAREVVEELHAGEPARRTEWVIAPQLAAQGDAGLLRVLLQNLLGNAWKYSSRRDDARIEFGHVEQEGRMVYFVRDNGAGFDMTYAKKLFGAFQRLHKASEFPGSGIGLATVARILHRHGGKAWAEGRVGEGATFYFSLG